MKSSHFLAALILQAACLAPSVARSLDSSRLPADLALAVANFDRAQVAGDAKALKQLLADNYVLVNSRAELENKAQFIDDYTAAGATLRPYRVEDPVVRTWRGGAVLSGVVTLRGTSGGHPFTAQIRFVDVWRKRSQRWQVVFTQAMRIPVQ